MFDVEFDTSEDLTDFLVVRYGENETRDDYRVKMLDVKMTDQFAGHEIARHEITGHEHDGQKMTARREIAGEKVQFYQR